MVRIDELVLENLLRLQASIEQLGEAPTGAALIKRRIKFFGPCGQTADETTGQFYDRLRHWFNLPLPQTNAPRHPPRQVE